MALETLRFGWSNPVRPALLDLLERRTGESFSGDLNGWWRWWWGQDGDQHPHYASFKSQLYGYIDPLFAGYFDDARAQSIRLDEARWGGVRQDGIPPLRDPNMIAADEAGWLADSDVVFGIEVEGDVRAYPKRILAWHEMFVDVVGNVEVAGVYCTLCGAVILYETELDGTHFELGTSGFLYRSNKLMYDRATQSLWSTTRGEPVVGPLVDRDIRLTRRPVVTTTWGEWRRRHPDTTVLDIETGYRRDYGEGVAYREYFASDELMFTVPTSDDRLANKAEVLALRFPGADGVERALALHADWLAEHPVHTDRVADVELVVLTDASGANRVYAAGETPIVDYDGDRIATDADGGRWTVTEQALVDEAGQERARLPAHRAFWFGWVAAFPDTRLVL